MSWRKYKLPISDKVLEKHIINGEPKVVSLKEDTPHLRKCKSGKVIKRICKRCL